MILEKIQSDLKEAMKAKDEARVSALRFLLAQIHNREIALHSEGKSLNDEETVAVIQKQTKERKESIAAFRQGGREELARKEESELSILNNYLPQQLTPEELVKTVEEIIKEMGTAGPGDFGKVMGAVMEKVKGRADGQFAGKLVRDLLGKS